MALSLAAVGVRTKNLTVERTRAAIVPTYGALNVTPGKDAAERVAQATETDFV